LTLKKVQKSSGIFTKLLLVIVSCIRAIRDANPDGMAPTRLMFDLTSRYVSDVSRPTVVGSVPCTVVLTSVKDLSKFRLPIADGMVLEMLE
jgi:hypothetical protein